MKEALFSEFYTKQYKECRSYIYYRVSDKELAEDLTQEAFARLWAYLKTHDEPPHLRAFFFVVAKNIIVDHYRKKRFKEVSIDKEAEDEFEKPIQLEDPTSAATLAEADEALEFVHRIVSPTYLKAFLAIRVWGMKPREAAEDLGVNTNVISTRVYRAEEQIRRALKRGKYGWKNSPYLVDNSLV